MTSPLRLAGPDDVDEINAILRHPEIWRYIAPEGMEPFDAPFFDCCAYFLVGDGDGVIIYHPFKDGVKIHPNIIPEKRNGLSHDAIHESMQMVFDAGVSKIYAEIDDKFPHAIKAAYSLGFSLLSSDERNLFIMGRK